MCDCYDAINKELETKNTRLEPAWLIVDGKWIATPMIVTQKLDDKKRGKAINLFPSYCPFCGEQYKMES